MSTKTTFVLCTGMLLASRLLSAEFGFLVDGKYRAPVPGIEEAYLSPVFASSHAANLLALKNAI